MKVVLFLLAVYFLFIPCVSGQDACTLELKGNVFDENGNRLKGATVFIKEINIGKVTDEAGGFLFQNLCERTYVVEVKFLGYETYVTTIHLNKSAELFIPLKSADKVLNEVIVYDHKENFTKTTNYAKLSSRELDESAGKSLGETLRGITGVNSIQTGPAIFKPVIHGVHSQRILLLNNGVRQEGQQWGAEHAPEIDPFVATNVVVIKDAAAIKYGTDALGGVIVVSPAELPTDQKLGGQFHLIGNTNNRGGIVSGLLEGGLKHLKGWGWRVQGTGKKYGDAHAANYNLSNTGVEELDYSAALGYHKENTGIELFYSHFNTTLGVLLGSAISSTEDLANAIEREPPQYTTDFTYTIQAPRQEVKHDLLKIKGHLRRGKNLYNLQYGFQANDRKEYDLRRGSLVNVPALGYKLYTQTLDAEWAITKNKKDTRSIGINGMWQGNNKMDGTQTLPFIPNYINYSTGIYWTESITKDKVNWDFGVRYDYKYYDVAGFDYSNQLYKAQLSFYNASATMGTTYQLGNSSTITSTLASTWRPPSVAELYSLGTHQSAAAIEYGLLLDETTNRVKDIEEVGFKTEKALKWVNTYRYQKKKFDMELSAYINYIFNYTYLKPRGVTETTRGTYPFFRYTQTDASFVGADVSANYSFTQFLSVGSKISLLWVKDQTNNDYLIFIPSNRYEVFLRYKVPANQKGITYYTELNARYIQEQYRAPRVVPIQDIIDAKEQGIDLFEDDKKNFDFVAAPNGYFLSSVNIGFSRPIHETKIDVRFSINNLSNTSYREYTNRLRYYSDDLGRNFTLAVKYSF
ncbi:MAG: carboxypeptidase-like regulatory domain-containing protein [Flammeovirgaceae bacterium]|nr:carboxypeptidase-like regulatory domain-containing protein [Flammeovirgaceae bacterium]